MTDVPEQIGTLEALRGYVLQTLCRQENLIEEQYRLQETVLTRKGIFCGRQFSLFGPRSIRLGAVWAADRNDLYFYDARGERFKKVRVMLDPQALTDAA